VTFHCRQCGTPLAPHEVGGNSALLVRPTPAYEAELEAGREFDPAGPEWHCRYLDGYPCLDCGTVDFAVSDLKQLLDCEDPNLPHSDWFCLECKEPCRGPLAIECFGVGAPPLAYLKHKFGAPLGGSLCTVCSRVWLRLHPADSEGRAELAARFPDEGSCLRCGVGRQRLTQMDLPSSGFAELTRSGTSIRVGSVWVAVCDSCGEALARLR
jgi:hypothetical protein